MFWLTFPFQVGGLNCQPEKWENIAVFVQKITQTDSEQIAGTKSFYSVIGKLSRTNYLPRPPMTRKFVFRRVFKVPQNIFLVILQTKEGILGFKCFRSNAWFLAEAGYNLEMLEQTKTSNIPA